MKEGTKKIDKLFSEARLWRREGEQLREILLQCDLSEELKWGKPCYAYDDKNICIIQRMKGFLALLFFKGALLKDPDNILEVQGPNSRSGCRVCFTSMQDVTKWAGAIKAYVRDAIEIERTGRKVGKPKDLDYPEELIDKFSEDPAFEAAFDKLTAGRKRGYILHFSEAKQSKTRVARIERNRNKVLDGKGLQE